jgi:hypothetical protein
MAVSDMAICGSISSKYLFASKIHKTRIETQALRARLKIKFD